MERMRMLQVFQLWLCQERGFVPKKGTKFVPKTRLQLGIYGGGVLGDFCNGAASKRGFLGLPGEENPFVLVFVGSPGGAGLHSCFGIPVLFPGHGNGYRILNVRGRCRITWNRYRIPYLPWNPIIILG